MFETDESTFRKLLGLVAFDEFFSVYWASRYVHIVRDNPGFYKQLVPLEDVDTFLQDERTPAMMFEVVTDGVTHGMETWSRWAESRHRHQQVGVPEQLLGLYRKGATLVLSHTDRMIPSIHALCHSMSRELGFAVWGNMYITPPGGSGFAKHTDDHEVFVLQLHGQKAWSVYEAVGTPTLVEMKAGDALYLPRGVEHSAACNVSPSVHLTLACGPAYGFELIQELSRLAEKVPAFQKAAPLASDGPARARFVTEFQEALAALIAGTNTNELLRIRWDRDSTVQRAIPGRLSSLLALPELNADTMVKLSSGLYVRVEEAPNTVKVSWMKLSRSFPLFLKKTVETVVAGNVFRAGDLPGLLPPDGKLELVRQLVADGLLQIVG